MIHVPAYDKAKTSLTELPGSTTKTEQRVGIAIGWAILAVADALYDMTGALRKSSTE